jgi:hypothetical protein
LFHTLFACAAACCHSKRNFKLHTLLPYLFDELRGGDTMAVLLLRSIIRQMTGVDGVRQAAGSPSTTSMCIQLKKHAW